MENERFHQEWTDQTVVSPVGLAVTIVLGLAILLLPRRYAFIPVCIMACFVAPGQRVILAGCNFQLLRLLVLIGWVRAVARGEFRSIKWGWIDTLMAAWAAMGLLVFSALYASVGAFVWRLGNMYDTAGMYFFCRCLIRGREDLEVVVRALMFISAPLLGAFLFEFATGHNIFAAFGGVPATTAVREGRLRCQGAFGNPIVAGCFWASLLPLIVAQWWRPNTSRALVCLAAICCLAIIILCASSTPVAAVAAVVLGAAVYPLRSRMRYLRWATVVAIVLLHCFMKAPVWALLARIDLAGGSTGYYRFLLLDGAIWHFGDWWLLGARSMAGWDPLLAEMGDVCNEFVLQGMRGGLITLTLFSMVIIACYGRVGKLWRSSKSELYPRILAWALGVSLFCHTLNFFGLSYFAQMSVAWYLLLASIAAMKSRMRTPTRVVATRGVETVRADARGNPLAQPTADASVPAVAV